MIIKTFDNLSKELKKVLSLSKDKISVSFNKKDSIIEINDIIYFYVPMSKINDPVYILEHSVILSDKYQKKIKYLTPFLINIPELKFSYVNIDNLVKSSCLVVDIFIAGITSLEVQKETKDETSIKTYKLLEKELLEKLKDYSSAVYKILPINKKLLDKKIIKEVVQKTIESKRGK